MPHHHHSTLNWIRLLLCVTLTASLMAACTPAPPKQSSNICRVFQQYPSWYWAAQDTQARWHVPISVQMAIIHQESHFDATAKPARTKLLWVIPWKRPSSAYGYSQALETTWKNYRNNRGRKTADRDDFDDVTDFIGWYANQAHQRAHIDRRDAYRLYLAYHEGVGGYLRGTYRQKPWLVKVAHKVDRTAHQYHAQLRQCQAHLPQKPWWRFW